MYAQRSALVSMALMIGVVLTLGMVGCGGGGSSAPPASGNNLLADVSTNAGVSLSPSFDSAIPAYAVGPAIMPGSVVVTPTAQDPGASITVAGWPVVSGMGSAPVTLGMGITAVDVVVTAPNGAQNTCVITFDRTSAQLMGLSASAGPLSPAFAPGALDYSLRTISLPASTTLTPTAFDPTVLIEVNTLATVSGSASAAVDLGAGVTPVTVVVRARDGVTSTTYTVVFDRSLGGEEGILGASNPGEDDRFGEVVAISGDTLVVGATREDSSLAGGPADNSAGAAGAVYVFVREGSAWIQQAFLKASNAEAGDRFGQAVGISGDTIVVSASSEDSSLAGGEADNSASYAGAVYVFVRVEGVWSQQAFLKASNAEAGDNFGYAVAISGDTIVVGAHTENSSAAGGQADNSAEHAGAAYVFVRSGTTWTQQAFLKASNAEQRDMFGLVVAISGDTIVVGAPSEDSSAAGGESDNSTDAAGAVYVFKRTWAVWVQEAYLKASNANASDSFGGAVAISGDTIVVGATYEAGGEGSPETDNSVYGAGAAYVFTRSGTTWAQQARLKAANVDARDLFGWSVGISGDVLVVGAAHEDSSAGGGGSDNSADYAGAAYVFTRAGTSWSQGPYLKASDAVRYQLFGSAVAVSGDAVVIGVNQEDEYSSAYVFR